MYKTICEEIFKENNDSGSFLHQLSSFKELSTTRWFSRDKNIRTATANLEALDQLLSSPELDGAGDDLYASVFKFQFLCPLFIAKPFFELINKSSESMQTVRYDIGRIGESVESLLATVKKWRDEKDNDTAFPTQFETLYSQAEEWCTKLGVKVEMGRERVRPQRLEGAASTAGMQQSASARAANAGESVKAKVY
jgi:hypothetical protein